MKHDNKIIRATKRQDVGELFMSTLLTTNFTVGKLWPGNSVLPTSRDWHVLLRYVTFTFDLYDLSINFCSGQVTYAGGVINPAIGFIPEGRMVFGKSARLIAQAETVCVTSLCFGFWLSSASSWPGPPKMV
jgi:hypothetical protein